MDLNGCKSDSLSDYFLTAEGAEIRRGTFQFGDIPDLI